jgi:hypothetical protein
VTAVGKPPAHSHVEPTIPIERKAGETGADVLDRVADTILPEAVKKGTKGPASKLPRQIAAIVYMRMQGMSNKDIAAKMGVKPKRITEIVYQARTQYNFSDILDRVQHQAIPQAIENLNEMLVEKDREATFQTLHGTGVFRKHTVNKDSGETKSNTLKVEISLPEGVSLENMPTVAVGAVLANPRSAPSLPPPVVETVNAV